MDADTHPSMGVNPFEKVGGSKLIYLYRKHAREREARSSNGVGVRGPLEGPGKFWILAALWCNLRRFLTTFHVLANAFATFVH